MTTCRESHQMTVRRFNQYGTSALRQVADTTLQEVIAWCYHEHLMNEISTNSIVLQYYNRYAIDSKDGLKTSPL
jgi:hypothetical protein